MASLFAEVLVHLHPTARSTTSHGLAVTPRPSHARQLWRTPCASLRRDPAYDLPRCGQAVSVARHWKSWPDRVVHRYIHYISISINYKPRDLAAQFCLDCDGIVTVPSGVPE